MTHEGLSISSMLNVADDFNLMQSMMERQFRDILSKKEALLKTALNDKGFGMLIDGIEKRRFPRIMREVLEPEGWECYYADDGTDEGTFIIAFQMNNSSLNTEKLQDRVSMTVSYRYTMENIFPLKSKRDI